MKNCGKQDLITNIENIAGSIGSRVNSADKTIAFVLKKHGVSNLERADVSTLRDLFDELFAIEADLR